MHGLADETVMNKVSVKTALNHVLTPNKNKLGNFSTIKYETDASVDRSCATWLRLRETN